MCHAQKNIVRASRLCGDSLPGRFWCWSPPDSPYGIFFPVSGHLNTQTQPCASFWGVAITHCFKTGYVLPIKATEFIQWLSTLNYRPEPLPPPEEFVDPPWPVPTPELAPPAAPALDLGPEPAAGGVCCNVMPFSVARRFILSIWSRRKASRSLSVLSDFIFV